ncbi:MAG: hypothetical protein QNJ45_13705 [Ardenticatenaceae bacterium]|nr:hypothetical protein [Ardenticatenaceae bacterium]
MDELQLSFDQHRELLRLFLLAWHESIQQQHRLLPALAKTLGTEPSTVYYHWAKPPHCTQNGWIKGTSWSFVFHGFADCDLKHEPDGRFLQVSFGPGGRYDVFSAWGTLQYVMASRPPWPTHQILKQFLAEYPPPYNHLAGSYHKMRALIRPLKQLGLFEVVDRDLLRLKSELSARHTRIDERGQRIYEPPDPFNNPEEKIFWDLEVAHARKLTSEAAVLIDSGLNEEVFADLWDERVARSPVLL